MPASGASPPTVTALTTNTQIAGAASIGADPVGGDPFYLAKLGESAFLHSYDILNKLAEPTVSVWTSTEALSQYYFDWDKALHSNGLSAHLVRISRRNLLRRLRYRCQFARPNVKNRFATSFLKVTGSDRCAEQGIAVESGSAVGPWVNNRVQETKPMPLRAARFART
jgi:hypothetical protein